MSEPSKELTRPGVNGGRLIARAGPGRRKGIPNRTTRLLKEAIIQAAEQVGEDGKGKDQLLGFLRRIARVEPRSFCMLLARVLPLQITGEDGGPVETRELTADEARERLRENGIPITSIFLLN